MLRQVKFDRGSILQICLAPLGESYLDSATPAIASVTNSPLAPSRNICLGTNKILVCAAHRAAASATLTVSTSADTRGDGLPTATEFSRSGLYIFKNHPDSRQYSINPGSFALRSSVASPATVARSRLYSVNTDSIAR